MCAQVLGAGSQSRKVCSIVPVESRFARQGAFYLAVAMFFLSGFAALAYQVIWYRLAGLFTGVDVRAATIVVSAFMLGLGAGNLSGGHLADRISRASSLIAFAVCEFCIGAFALASKIVFYDVLYLRVGASTHSYWALIALAFAGFLWPTFFMGMSLPLLAKGMTLDLDSAARRVGSLYGFNTLGGAVGAFVTTWYLVRAFDFETSLRIGAAMNLAVALGAIPLGLLWRASSEQRREPRPEINAATDAESNREHAGRTAYWLAIYFSSGFVALSLEMVWFRILGVMLKATAFTFGSLLAVYLGGLAAGAVLGGIMLRWSKRAGAVFLGLQVCVGLYAGLSLAVLAVGLDRWAVFSPIRQYLGEYEPLALGYVIAALAGLLREGQFGDEATASLVRTFALMYGVVPLLLIGPPTLLMGIGYPFMQRAVHRDLDRLGRRVGWLGTANIIGCVIGSSVTGLFLMGALGTAGTLKLLVALTAAYAVLWARSLGQQKWITLCAGCGAVLAVGSVVCLTPSNAPLWALLHGTSVDAIVHVEDGSGLSVIKSEGNGAESTVYVNGRGESTIPFGSIHSVLGALPAMLHPDPKDIAVIGLGSGDTVYHIGGRPETESITCVEIIGSQLKMLKTFQAQSEYAPLRKTIGDGRVRNVVADGRFFLLTGDARYDIIEADALRPESAYSGFLYSEEYFALLRSRLKPGGIAVTWCPTERVRNTFVRVFPYVWDFGELLIGSSEAVDLDVHALEARTQHPFAKDYYADGVEGVADMLRAFVEKHPPKRIGPEAPRDGYGEVNSDLYPRDEFLVPIGARTKEL